MVALSNAFELPVNEAVKYIINNSKTPNAAMNMISRYKKLLTNEEDIKTLQNNKDRLKNQEVANKLLIESRENKRVNLMKLPEYFNLYDLTERLKTYITSEFDLYTIIDLLIAFSARPSELYKLHFKGYKIGGHLKQRDENNYYPYRGLYNYTDAKHILNKLKNYRELDPSKNTVRFKLEKIMRENYNLQLRDLRQIGANYIAGKATPEKKRIDKQYALRHKNISTSVINYDRPGS